MNDLIRINLARDTTTGSNTAAGMNHTHTKGGDI
jgi:hypothetical protein